MAKWLKMSSGNYLNLDHITGIVASEQSAGVWVLNAFESPSFSNALSGTWSSQAAAQEAIRELVDGLDPASYGD